MKLTVNVAPRDLTSTRWKTIPAPPWRFASDDKSDASDASSPGVSSWRSASDDKPDTSDAPSPSVSSWRSASDDKSDASDAPSSPPRPLSPSLPLPLSPSPPFSLSPYLPLLLLALALRLWGLADRSIWLDEALMLERAQSDVWTAIQGRTPPDLAPPLYPMLLHVWSWLGVNDFFSRALSVVFGTLAVAVLTRLRPRPVGYAAALIYAIAPTQVYYAQEVNTYALVGLLAVAAIVTADHARRGSRRAWLLLAVVAVVSAYTYYGLFFLFISLDLWLLKTSVGQSVGLAQGQPLQAGRRRGNPLWLPLRWLPLRWLPASWATFLLGHGVVFLLCLPLLPLLRLRSELTLEAWWGQYGSLDGWTGLVIFLQGSLANGLLFSSLPFSHPPRWVIVVLALLVSFGALRRPGLFLAGVALPLGLAYVASALGRYPFEGRYLLFTAPALYVLMSAAGLPERAFRLLWLDMVSSLRRITHPTRAVGGFLFLVLIFILVTSWRQLNLAVPWAPQVPHEDLRPLLAALKERHRPDEAIYVTYGATSVARYYFGQGVAPQATLYEEGWPAGRLEYQASRVLLAADGQRWVWVVISHAPPGEEEALAAALTRRGAWLVERLSAPGAAAMLFKIND